ncbi:MAG: hypothetical protein ACJAVK_001392 [Akkermansiaceae bacterium]|jgi:hypothetical protein
MNESDIRSRPYRWQRKKSAQLVNPRRNKTPDKSDWDSPIRTFSESRRNPTQSPRAKKRLTESVRSNLIIYDDGHDYKNKFQG